MGALLEQIAEWLKGMLVDGIMNNLSGMFDAVNRQVADVATQVGSTPASFSPGVFALVRNISESVIKELLGDEYHDYNLLFANASGRPMEGQVINRALSKLIKDNDLPPVVFHSIRHSSITYKLKWTEGDIKSVQGDSGHARADMVADVYSHILDEDRAINAQRFDEKFYGNPSPSDGMPDDPPAEQPQGVLSMQEMLMGVLTNPEMSKAFQEFFLQQQASSKAAT